MSSEPPLRHPLIALILVGAVPSLGAASALYFFDGPVGTVLWGFSKAILYLFPALWSRLADGRPFGWSPLRRGGLGAGWLTGVLAAAVILAAWHFFGRAWFDPGGLRAVAVEKGFATPARFILLGVWLCLANSLMEEYVFRWFLLSRARAFLGAAPAVAVASLVFSAHHVVVLYAYFGWLAAAAAGVGTFVAGAVWCVLTLRYGSIWPAWASHVIADVAMLLVGYEVLFA